MMSLNWKNYPLIMYNIYDSCVKKKKSRKAGYTDKIKSNS